MAEPSNGRARAALKTQAQLTPPEGGRDEGYVETEIPDPDGESNYWQIGGVVNVKTGNVTVHFISGPFMA